MDTTPEEAAQVVALINAGQNQSQVARQLNLSRSAVRRVYQRFVQTGGFVRRHGSGRHRVTNRHDDHFVIMASLRNRHLNAVQLAQRLQSARHVTVSRWTVRRRLAERGLTAHRPANGPKLTTAHRQARLQFAREHLNWTIDQWKTVLFSDECRICLYGNDGRGRVYRRPGERFAQCCISERVAYGGGSCMVWGGISLEAKTALVFLVGANSNPGAGGLTSERYINEVLEEHVVPYAGYVGENFLFMHDNARPHTAAIVQQYLQEVGIPVMEWPARSPDMNPIEHMWAELKRRIRARTTPPSDLQELQVVVREEWDAIPQDFVFRLIRSMKNRMREVIRARGGNTSY